MILSQNCYPSVSVHLFLRHNLANLGGRRFPLLRKMSHIYYNQPQCQKEIPHLLIATGLCISFRSSGEKMV